MSKISFLFPSRSRPAKFFAALNNLISYSISDNFEVICVLDTDDPEMNTKYATNLLGAYGTRGINIVQVWGKSENKIHACNRALNKVAADTEIVCLMSDDFFMTKKGYDEDIRAAFAGGFKGLVHFPDGRVDNEPKKKHAVNFYAWVIKNKFEAIGQGKWSNGMDTYSGLGGVYDAYFLEQKQRLVTFPIMHKSYLDVDGWIYHPKFKSVCCDDLQTALAKKRGMYKFVDTDIMVHQHYRNGFGEPDELMKHNDSQEMYETDLVTLVELKAEYNLL